MSSPIVSVLMVYHRGTPFLVPAVRSILTQTLRDVELVLVDNGSGLGVSPLGEWGRDPRLRLVRRTTNGGIADGHNTALANARGEFIALLDYDDIALPDRLEKQVAALRAEPRLGIVFSRVDAIDAHDAVIGPEFVLLDEKEAHLYSAFNVPCVMPSVAGRSEVFRSFPYRPELRWAPDYDFLARAAEAWPMRGLPEVLVHYRHHDGQTTQSCATEQILGACMIRLLTARRRSGRPEALPEIVAEFGDWLCRPPPLAAIYARFADCAMSDGSAPLAVYFARKLLSVKHNPASIARAGRVLASAIRAGPHSAVYLLRLFFTGPVRTHRLNRA